MFFHNSCSFRPYLSFITFNLDQVTIFAVVMNGLHMKRPSQAHSLPFLNLFSFFAERSTFCAIKHRRPHLGYRIFPLIWHQSNHQSWSSPVALTRFIHHTLPSAQLEPKCSLPVYSLSCYAYDQIIIANLSSSCLHFITLIFMYGPNAWIA